MNMLEWVLCSDRVPNDSRTCLCYCGDYRYGFGRYITSKTIKMINSVNMINIFVELINKLRQNSQTEV